MLRTAVGSSLVGWRGEGQEEETVQDLIKPYREYFLTITATALQVMNYMKIQIFLNAKKFI